MDSHRTTWTHTHMHSHTLTHTYTRIRTHLGNTIRRHLRTRSRSRDCAAIQKESKGIWQRNFVEFFLLERFCRKRERKRARRVCYRNKRAEACDKVDSVDNVANHNPQECSCFQSCIAHHFVTSHHCVGLGQYQYIVRPGGVVVEIAQQTRSRELLLCHAEPPAD